MLKSPNHKEKTWEYDFCLVLNEQLIDKITITDHPWKKLGREWITHELILGLVKTLHGREIESEPKKKPSDREVFVRNRILYRGKRFRLVFWFKDGTTNHLWIRNCHPQD